jgi:hypothetical protein
LDVQKYLTLFHRVDLRIQFLFPPGFAMRTEITSQRALVSSTSLTSCNLVNIDFVSDAVQPISDGQAAGMWTFSGIYLRIHEQRSNSTDGRFKDEVGLGQPTENP